MGKIRMKKQWFRNLLAVLLPAIITFAVNMFAYMVPKQVVPPSRYIFIDMEIDRLIPFVPWFVIFYYLAFVQWFNYFLQVSFGDRTLRNRYFSADIISKIILFFIFMIWPTAVNRPAVDGLMGFWKWALSMTFTVDNPLGALPSIHCYYSWLAFRYSLDAEPKERRWITLLQLIMSLLVFASTVLVKQHYFIDIIGGVIYAEVFLWIERHTGIAEIIGGWFDRIQNRLSARSE
ncbi:MAG: phosphatase PAP2 family protein [Erysipelotrichaceae bacterium]|nr:phosphatase PAP2 family protein [Erysipelotrichaceae bacterium]